MNFCCHGAWSKVHVQSTLTGWSCTQSTGGETFPGGGLRGEHGRPPVGTNRTFLLFTGLVTAVGSF